ncbi:MAG: hypothetical protein ACRCX4_12410 [Bacteroidales bacterium]
MNKSRFTLSVIAFLCALVLYPANKTLPAGQADISTFRRVKDSVYIAIRIKQTQRISTMRELVIQPVISSGRDSLFLTPYAIRGRYNNNLHKRDELFSSAKNIDKSGLSRPFILNKNQMKGRELFIDTVIPFQPWMKDADLKLHADLCGCGVEQAIICDSKNLDYRPSLMEIHPFLAFTKARTEDSFRNQSKNYMLYFRVNECMIDTTYLENPETLCRLRSDLNELSRTFIRISKMDITGFASPEGPLSGNRRLASARSAAFAGEIKRLSPETEFPDPLVHITYEDWQGLTSELKADSSALAQTAYEVLRNGKETEDQKSELRHIGQGKVYDFLKQNSLNRLRRSGLSIEFEIIPEKIISERNLPENIAAFVTYDALFGYAQSMVSDSAQMRQFIYKATEYYPSNRNAHLNAGVMALRERETEEAERHLKNADGEDNPAEWYNAMGVLCLLKDKNNDARSYFQRAKEKGLSEVEENIRILDSPDTM